MTSGSTRYLTRRFPWRRYAQSMHMIPSLGRAALASIGFALLLLNLGHAETAAQDFETGQARLAKGDWEGAVQHFASAARAQKDNPEYARQFALTRQAMALRRHLPKETNPVQWERAARGLHAFYVSQRLYPDALALDRQLHAKLNTTATALMLAETTLALGRSGEAVEVMGGVESAKQTPASRMVHALALAHAGQPDAARALAASVSLSAETNPVVLFAAARLQAITRDQAGACSLLTRCLQNVPPSQSDSFKQRAQTAPEFASLKATGPFTQALETKSTVAESSCSGGSTCASCPSRTACAQPEGR